MPLLLAFVSKAWLALMNVLAAMHLLVSLHLLHALTVLEGLMATVALCGQKGGAGKTTLAISLAAEWHKRGLRTLLVDLDPQGTATTWGDIAAEEGLSGPTVVGMGDAVRTRLPGIAADYDVTVIDCPPRAGKRTVGALMVADLAVLPCAASPADLWALSEALDVVGQAQALRPELKVRIALNQVLSTSTLGRSIEAALSELDVTRMRRVVHYRVEMARALATGLGVTAARPSCLASEEIRRWVDEIEDVLEMHEEEPVSVSREVAL